MCGIAAVLSGAPAPRLPPSWPLRHSLRLPAELSSHRLPPIGELTKVLKRRGPDASSSLTIPIDRLGEDQSSTLTLLSTTLSIRHPPEAASPSPAPEASSPSLSPTTPHLLFNGEIYDVLPSPSSSSPPDTSHIASLLHPLLTSPAISPALEEKTLASLDALRGPYALIAWAPAVERLYFARDILGRRSLLLAAVPNAGFVLSSAVPTAYTAPFSELPPAGLFFFDVPTRDFGLVPRASREVVYRAPRPAKDNETLALRERKGREEVMLGRLSRSYLPERMSRACCRRVAAGEGDSGGMEEEAVDVFIAAFRKSVQRRVVAGEHLKECGAFAVLFSGGLDSLLIAVVLDEILPVGESLELVNVAFGADDDAIALCPDRVSAIAGYEELLGVSRGSRKIQLVCVDVTAEMADTCLEETVRGLIYPCEQPMDASIGTALWQAGRGRGYVHGDSGKLPHSIAAPILFSGLGADELAGGYKGRHRTIYRIGGAEAVEEEIDADLARLWYRNLGRDDRLIADSGRELRHPFLDEDLVAAVSDMPLVQCVCDLGLPDGVGDKILLRRAAVKLGLPSAACQRPKRAIQFGSRSKQVLERRK